MDTFMSCESTLYPSHSIDVVGALDLCRASFSPKLSRRVVKELNESSASDVSWATGSEIVQICNYFETKVGHHVGQGICDSLTECS